MPDSVRYVCFRVTFNAYVGPEILAVKLSQLGSSGTNPWRGFFCVETSDGGVLHGHGVIFNRTQNAVRQVLGAFSWGPGSGIGGNENYSVSTARDNTAAVRYACKDLGPPGERICPDDVVSLLWISGCDVSFCIESFHNFWEYRAGLEAENGEGIVQASGSGAAPSAGTRLVRKYVDVCVSDSLTTMPEIVRMILEDYAAREAPAPFHVISSVAWTVYMRINQQTGVEDAVTEVLRRMGYPS